MELDFDFEPPEKRVISWLLQNEDSLASFESKTENPANKDVVMDENYGSNMKKVSRMAGSDGQESNEHKFSTREKNGLKSSVTDVSELSSAESDNDLKESEYNTRLYSDIERQSIIKYIVEKKLFPFVKGNYIWKQMEKERICARTWQSMKAQFQRYIYPHLEKFPLAEADKNFFVKCMERSPAKKSPGYLSPGQRGWRTNCKLYSFLEDALILYYILEKNRHELTNGNILWKVLEFKNIVPGRTWHSMKSRYKTFLFMYIEKFAPINKVASKPQRLDSAKKSKILQDFLLDHILDIAVTINCIPESRRSVNKLKSIGLDCSFTIPLPWTDLNLCEKDIIQHCALKVVHQLSEKLDTLLMLSHDSAKQCEEMTDVFSPEQFDILDDIKNKNEILNLSDKSKKSVSIQCNKQITDKFDLSESVQRGLRISKPISWKKKHEIRRMHE